MTQAYFIVLEGVDGAGTTTHSRVLGDSLAARGIRCHVTQQPSPGPVGSMLRLMLQGRVVGPNLDGRAAAPAWGTMALLFAADRLDHLDSEILPKLRDGITVLCDRYYHSSLAYQSCTGGSSDSEQGWLLDINARARRPDLTLVLDVPAAVAAERRGRRAGRELYDDDELQERLCRYYAGIDRHLPGERIKHIQSGRPLQDVAAEIARAVATLRGEA